MANRIFRGLLAFCSLFLLRWSFVAGSDPSTSSSHTVQRVTSNRRNDNVHPNAVRSYHRYEALRHVKQGGEGAYKAIKKGIVTSFSTLFTGCISGGNALEGVPHSIRNAHTGCAACTNTSYFSMKNIAKHLKKSITRPRRMRSRQEFEQERQNDRDYRENGYERLRQETSTIRTHWHDS